MLLYANDYPVTGGFGSLQSCCRHSPGRDAKEGALPRFRPFVRGVYHVLCGRLHLVGQAIQFERSESAFAAHEPETALLPALILPRVVVVVRNLIRVMARKGR